MQCHRQLSKHGKHERIKGVLGTVIRGLGSGGEEEGCQEEKEGCPCTMKATGQRLAPLLTACHHPTLPRRPPEASRPHEAANEALHPPGALLPGRAGHIHLPLYLRGELQLHQWPLSAQGLRGWQGVCGLERWVLLRVGPSCCLCLWLTEASAVL